MRVGAFVVVVYSILLIALLSLRFNFMINNTTRLKTQFSNL